MWPSPIALALGSLTVLGVAGAVYYRVRITHVTQPVATTLPTITYAAHWDRGTQRIEAHVPLARGTGLRLQSGVDTITITLQTDDLVAKSHEREGARS